MHAKVCDTTAKGPAGASGKACDELLSVQEIADELEQRAISKSSVYRNLAELETEGVVRRKYSGAAGDPVPVCRRPRPARTACI